MSNGIPLPVKSTQSDSDYSRDLNKVIVELRGFEEDSKEKQTIASLITALADINKENITEAARLKLQRFIVNTLATLHHRIKRAHGESAFVRIENLEQFLAKYNSSTSTASAVNKLPSKASRAIEQQRLLEQKELDSKIKFHELLEQVQQYACPKGHEPKSVFISYAWPLESANDLDEADTQRFVTKIQEHLEMAGLRVVRDQRDNKSEQVHGYMKGKIEESQHVIVICNRTMQYKYYILKIKGVVEEYSYYMEAQAKKQQQKQAGNFLLLVGTTEENSAPGVLREWPQISIYHNGYLRMLYELIFRIYGMGNKFEAFWQQELQKRGELAKYWEQQLRDGALVTAEMKTVTAPSALSAATATTAAYDVKQNSSVQFSAALSTDNESLAVPNNAVKVASVISHAAQVVKRLSPEKLQIDFKSLYEAATLAFAGNEKDIQQAKTLLQKINDAVDAVNHYEAIGNKALYYPMIRDELESIRRQCTELKTIKTSKIVLRNTIVTQIEQAITAKCKIIEAYLVEPNTEKQFVLTQKTQALHCQQSMLARSAPITQAFTTTLQDVKKLIPVNLLNKSCFISYARPTDDWLQPFLRILHGHLSVVGINPILDIINNKPGGNTQVYMKQCRDSEYTILICTESLLLEHQDEQMAGIKTELVHIQSKYNLDAKSQQVRVFPLLLSGSRQTSCPESYQRHVNVCDWREQSYIENLKRLICSIYYPDGASNEYEGIWESFYKQYPALREVMPTSEVEKTLKQMEYEKSRQASQDESFYRTLSQANGISFHNTAAVHDDTSGDKKTVMPVNASAAAPKYTSG